MSIERACRRINTADACAHSVCCIYGVHPAHEVRGSIFSDQGAARAVARALHFLLLMRINDLVALSLGTTPAAAGRKARETGASRQGAEEQSGGRGRLTTPRINFKAAPGRNAATENTPPVRQDTVELSSPTTRIARGSRAMPRASETDTQSPQATNPQSPLAGITDQFVRQRAVYSFSMPIGGGGTFSLTYEVESSYRVIRFLEPGQLIDAEA